MGIRQTLCLVLLLASCRAQPVATPTVRTDVAGLRELIALPPQTGEVRWVLHEHVPDGCSWVPGPSDTSILARVTLDDAGWTDLMARTGAVRPLRTLRTQRRKSFSARRARRFSSIPRSSPSCRGGRTSESSRERRSISIGSRSGLTAEKPCVGETSSFSTSVRVSRAPPHEVPCVCNSRLAQPSASGSAVTGGTNDP